jgi:hypothetical protein
MAAAKPKLARARAVPVSRVSKRNRGLAPAASSAARTISRTTDPGGYATRSAPSSAATGMTPP